MQGEQYRDVLKEIPVSINNIIGDPFIPAQIEDTFYKLSSLRASGHKGPISIITKSKFDAAMLERLSLYGDMANLIVFYTLTGMEEGGIPFPERIQIYKELAQLKSHTVLLYRPIIQGYNDSLKIIKTMVDLCGVTGTRLVYTGFYNQKKEKFLDPGTEAKIVQYAKEMGVGNFPKSACATSDILGDVCYAHVNEGPMNLKLIRKLYDIEDQDGKIVLPYGTPGDRNFIRFITHTNATINKSEPYHFLSLQTEVPLLCSSSWFSWSQIVPCSIGCWYCSTEYVFPECKEPKQIGCNPVEIPRLVLDNIFMPVGALS